MQSEICELLGIEFPVFRKRHASVEEEIPVVNQVHASARVEEPDVILKLAGMVERSMRYTSSCFIYTVRVFSARSIMYTSTGSTQSASRTFPDKPGSSALSSFMVYSRQYLPAGTLLKLPDISGVIP